ncbi:right-handed parallel beta-helix repeat-containing protein [Staphylococcus epidermidis]|uniref:right-handed parallel beta-helix repeat-containing protein n=1 Tax=Staphylococcus epidermidis TaxID=1282 RepID=UPI0018808837|nr:right-handed parallel beta-helix repeat-containing protein [Staphylococcus epidermidis]MBE9409808.1 right-handed parallel beta-helix repeat-containing protein [Staphylococcus epidermidis]MBG3866705.1 right-handed parallel beta-helix repeat-containing protein [Staphylococcus epidermidis]
MLRLQKNRSTTLGQRYRREDIDNDRKIENTVNRLLDLNDFHKEREANAHDSKQITHKNTTVEGMLVYQMERIRNLVQGIDSTGSREVTDSRVSADGTIHGLLSERLLHDHNETKNDIKRVEKQLVEINLDEYNSDKTGKKDASRDIQDALNRIKDAGGGILYIPSGVFLCTGRMYIYSNTTVKMEDNTILLRGHSQGFFDNGDPLVERVTYEGEHNIKIMGGVLDNNLEQIDKYPTTHVNMINLRHADNITIEGVRFKNSISHHCIDVNGSKNLLIQNCIFEGYINPLEEVDKEAIQLSGYDAGGINGGVFDNTITKDVIIKYNKFRPSALAPGFNVCIGHHSAKHNVWQNNFEISNNDFRECHTGVRSFKFKNVRIIDNVFQEMVYPIRISAVGGEYQSANDVNGIPSGKSQGALEHVIRGNYFRNFNVAVSSFGRYYRGSFGYNEHISITNNYFIGEDWNKALSISVELTRNLHINDNIFSNCFRGIQVMSTHYLYVKNNHMTNMKTEGMYIKTALFPGEANVSTHIHVTGNTLNGSGKNGIFLQNANMFSIKSNDVTNTNEDEISDGSKRGGVKVFECENGIISENQSYGKNQVFVANADVVKNVTVFNNAGVGEITVTNATNSVIGYNQVDQDGKIVKFETVK